MQQPQINVPIKHTSYVQADFYTGNVITNHQYSVIVSTKNNNQKGISEDTVVFHLNQVKQYLTDQQYKLIFDTAMRGGHLTVYVIRNKDVKQGIFVLDHTGNVVFYWPERNRKPTIELMEGVLKIVSNKAKNLYAILFESGRESKLMC